MSQTAKQKKCPHPWQHVHPTYDLRWQVCDLCKLISPRPIPAPWIVAHDEAQPAEPAPELFTEPAPAPVKVRAKRTPARMTEAAIRARDDALLGFIEEETPPLDPAIAVSCHRCGGSGKLYDLVERTCPRCQGSGKVCPYIVGL